MFCMSGTLQSKCSWRRDARCRRGLVGWNVRPPEAEVDARRIKEKVWFVLFSLLARFLVLSPMDRKSIPSTASNTPATVTEMLFAIQLTHARLLAERGSNIAPLRRREAKLESLTEREAEAYWREEWGFSR